MIQKTQKRFISVLFALLTLTVLPCYVRAESIFADVADNSWYAAGVEYVYQKGFMNGVTSNTFEPESKITRGMVVTIIYRLEGKPSVTEKFGYTDVAENDYYFDSVMWATETCIVNGYGGSIFAPQDTITREQFATILYRYSKYKGFDISVDNESRDTFEKYSDSSSISPYAQNAMEWALVSGLITGITPVTLEPQETATRAQAATVLMRFDGWCDSDNNGKQETDSSTSGTSDSSSSNGSDEKETEHITDGNKRDNDSSSSHDRADSSKANEKTDDNKEETTSTHPTLKVSDTSTDGKKSIEVSVSIKNNPGTSALLVSFEYDENAVKLKEIRNGEVFTSDREYVFTAPKNTASGCRASWYTLNELPATNDGVVAILCFEVLEDAPEGTYSINIKCEPDNAINAIEENIDFKTVNGSIVIKQKDMEEQK